MTQDSNLLGAFAEYWTDAWQRGVLVLETLNERGNIAARAGGQGGAACAEPSRRSRARRPDAGAAGQLPARSHRPAGGRDDRSG